MPVEVRSSEGLGLASQRALDCLAYIPGFEDGEGSRTTFVSFCLSIRAGQDSYGRAEIKSEVPRVCAVAWRL